MHCLIRASVSLAPVTNRAPPSWREALIEEMNRHSENREAPVKPQKIITDLRTVLALDDIVACDVGAHKMWMARMFRCGQPNTCIISNGFASVGIAVPWSR